MVFTMPIPPKPPWHSTPTAIESLPVAASNCNSLIESPTDTLATENCKNKSYDNIIENDRPDDDNDNTNNDDVDCFPWQDKQPVIPQQHISPTAPIANTTPPSLIASPMEKSTDTTDTDNMNTDNNNNTNNDTSGTRTTPTRTKQITYQGFGPKQIYYDVACFHQHDKQPMLPQDADNNDNDNDNDDDDDDDDDDRWWWWW